jgi:putative DNA primase/helicase
MLQLAARVAESISLEALQEQDEDRVKAILKFCNQSQNVPKLKSMLEMARSSPGVLVDADVFDPDNYLFCVQNGVVDLRTGKLRDAQKSDLITKYAKLDYDENAKAPLWNKFVHEIMGGDEELVQLLKRAIGYSLTGDTSEQVLFLLHGGGSNGKTVFIETLKKIFGTYSMATDAGILLLNSRANAARAATIAAKKAGAQ